MGDEFILHCLVQRLVKDTIYILDGFTGELRFFSVGQRIDELLDGMGIQ